MPATHLEIRAVPAPLRQGLIDLQRRLGLPREFSHDVVADAESAASRPPGERVDLTNLEFVTIDPPASRDLDQALLIERDGDGYLVHYAIADVGHFVRVGTALERETHRRGQTLYAPSAKVPLHPKALSEDAASLLAEDRPRPAMVWRHRLDGRGALVDTSLTRALVRSRAKLSYEAVRADLDAGQPHPSIALLPAVGSLRDQIELERGGVSLNLPAQEIVERDGTWHVEYRQPSPIERYNAHISLLTGFAAAQTMLQGKVGIVRTLPPAQEWALAKLRRAAATLDVRWPREMTYPRFVRSLSPRRPAQLAVLTKCTVLFRGAGYRSFDGELPDENLTHAALAAPYAHTTAPLRRLVDRYVLEICHALLNELPIPNWAREALPRLPEEMAASARLANAYERGVLDLAEALVLRDRVGETLTGVITDVHPKTGLGTVQLAEPAVELRLQVSSDAVGSEVRIRIDAADVTAGRVECSLA